MYYENSMGCNWAGGIAQRRTIPEGITQAHNAELVRVYDINKQINTEVAKKKLMHFRLPASMNF